jgi:hypothetical protein
VGLVGWLFHLGFVCLLFGGCWLLCGGVVMSALVGFSGSRSFGPASPGFALVPGLVSSVLAGGRAVAVGCAPGLDACVRAACPSAVVFRASFVGGLPPAAALALRSAALVRAVASSGPGAGFVAFPVTPCPPGLSPSSLPSACFSGSGSGTWASAAFAAGLGLPLVVFGLPASALPTSWGIWSPAAPSGVWSSGFRLLTAAPCLPGFGL